MLLRPGMKLKRWILGALVALALLAGAGARPARACGGGYFTGTDLLIGVGALGAAYGDIAFTIGDTVLAAQGRRPPAAYGVLEALVAAPQAGLFAYWAYNTSRAQGGDATFPVVLTLWTAALTAHGIYTIARANPETKVVDEPPRHASVDWRVAPAMVTAGPSSTAPGAVLFGRF